MSEAKLGWGRGKHLCGHVTKGGGRRGGRTLSSPLLWGVRLRSSPGHSSADVETVLTQPFLINTRGNERLKNKKCQLHAEFRLTRHCQNPLTPHDRVIPIWRFPLKITSPINGKHILLQIYHAIWPFGLNLNESRKMKPRHVEAQRLYVWVFEGVALTLAVLF